MKETVCFAKKYGHFILIIGFQMVPLGVLTFFKERPRLLVIEGHEAEVEEG